jgi:hypothetical protein
MDKIGVLSSQDMDKKRKTKEENRRKVKEQRKNRVKESNMKKGSKQVPDKV